MARKDSDPYLVLGVSPTATQADADHLQQLLAAYALLRDPTRRADYDRATPHTDTPLHQPHRSTPVARRAAGPLTSQ